MAVKKVWIVECVESGPLVDEDGHAVIFKTEECIVHWVSEETECCVLNVFVLGLLNLHNGCFLFACHERCQTCESDDFFHFILQ